MQGDALTTDARKDFKEAKHEQNVSDQYTVVDVILASALLPPWYCRCLEPAEHPSSVPSQPAGDFPSSR
jgi:hypothetical protein